MSLLTSRKPWQPKRPSPPLNTPVSSVSKNPSHPTLLRVGLLLLIIGSAMGVFGCAQQPVKVQCPPYPELPQELRDYVPANRDLVPLSMLPNVKSGFPAR